MRHRCLGSLGALLVVTSLLKVAPVPVAAQAPSVKPSAALAAAARGPRTPWGNPDLSGQWNGQTSTPLQRPQSGPLASKDVLSDEEAETLEEANRVSIDSAPRAGDPGTYNAFWRDPGKALTRTSLIVDPPDGRIPPFTPDGQKRIDAERAERAKRGPSDSPDSYEDLSVWTRCISRGWNGIGSYYSSSYQIVQAPGYVVVYQELIHEPRIIPLDGRPHIGGTIPQWMGDSRGHWEGDTLVVDTTNFDPRATFQGARQNLHLIERYTRTDADTIDYQFTIDDPTTFTRAWTVARPLRRVPEGISVFEYACHEGNYALAGILAGARAGEAATAAAAKKGSR